MKKEKKLLSKNKLGKIDPTVSGIDIGSKLIHVSIPQSDGETLVVEYGTTTPELHQIARDLKEAGVLNAVMEATGVYWIPLFETLESEEYGIQPILVDAKSVKNVPGRKTDVLDCQWIQTLYSAGLLRAAFRPPKDRIPLREYVRVRGGVVKTRQRALLQIEKSLQLMNIKLSSALSDIAGVSGMAIVRAIDKGERDPKRLAALRHSSCRKREEDFVAALTGNYQEEHLFALKMALKQYDYSHKQMEQCDRKILSELKKLPIVTEEPPPVRAKDIRSDGKVRGLRKPEKNMLSFNARSMLWTKSGVDFTALPGVSELTALTIFAELGGSDVSAWRSEKEFSSWLKLSPGNNISGGKRRKSKYCPSANPISQALRLSSVACKRSNSAIGAFIRKICGRADNPKGIKAGAHRIARVLFQMCKHGMNYVEKGEECMEKAYEERVLKRLKARAKSLGYSLEPAI